MRTFYKESKVFFTIWFVLLFIYLLSVVPTHAQDAENAVLQKTTTIQWTIENREADVQHYQIYISDPADHQKMIKHGDPILVTGAEWTDKTVMTQDVAFAVPAEKDTFVFLSVSAIDTSGNESVLSNPYVGYRFMLQPPAPPLELKGGSVD